jgi:hypothetical protein
MPKNNSRARKQWRKDRLAYLDTIKDPQERLLQAIFGNRKKVLFEPKPGTEEPEIERKNIYDLHHPDKE